MLGTPGMLPAKYGLTSNSVDARNISVAFAAADRVSKSVMVHADNKSKAAHWHRCSDEASAETRFDRH